MFLVNYSNKIVSIPLENFYEYLNMDNLRIKLSHLDKFNKDQREQFFALEKLIYIKNNPKFKPKHFINLIDLIPL